jgi:predicted ArsR family transcriptional regulator
LLLSAGYGGWQFMRLVGHADLIEEHHCPFASLARREHVAEVHRQHHVLDQ